MSAVGRVPSGGADGGDAVARAHEGLVRDGSYQFSFDAASPPPERPRGLEWLEDLLALLAPVLQWVFWGAVALVVAAIVLWVVKEALGARFPSLRRKAKTEAAPEWRPDVAVARALLSDADRLAAEGRYAEAARLLLLRSVDDIEERDPRLLRPSLTSRDIAALEALPGPARSAFGFIAGVVEIGVFGGRPVNAHAWGQCREAYARFALPEGWGPQTRAA